MSSFSDSFICSIGRLSAHPFFLPVEINLHPHKVPACYKIVIKQNFALGNVAVEADSSPLPQFSTALFKFPVTCFFPQLCPE